MRRILFLVIIFNSVFWQAHAQQLPQYTQYLFNQYLLNPALSGIENYTDAKVGYRSQWTGLQGAPVTSYFTINAPLGSDFVNGDPNELPADGQNPAERSYTQYYQAAAPHHGIGFMVVTDKAGPLTQTNIDATYAYHIGLTSNLNLSLGVSAGVARTSLNTAEITLENSFDPAIYDGNNSKWNPDLGVGVWAYSANYFIGASVEQVLPQTLYFSSNNVYNQSKTVPHYFFTAGYKLFLSDDIYFTPSFMIKEINPVPLTFDINGKVSFRDVFWLGASYRKGDSFGVLAGFFINNFLNVGYSYDITTSALNTVSNGTHEIVIGILLNNKYNVSSPQRTF